MIVPPPSVHIGWDSGTWQHRRGRAKHLVAGAASSKSNGLGMERRRAAHSCSRYPTRHPTVFFATVTWPELMGRCMSKAIVHFDLPPPKPGAFSDEVD